MVTILREIFNELNKKNINYIHWKSNEHLEAALQGDTDLDILVHPSDQKKFIHIIEQHGFTLYKSVGKQSYISISDYIFLDSEAGKVLHIHLHNKFIVGRKFYKEYAIPLEEYFFIKPEYHSEFPVKIMNPSQEFVLLWVRFFLKTNSLKFFLKRGNISSDFIRESNWLMKRINNSEVVEAIDNFLLTNDVKTKKLFTDFLYANKNLFHTAKMLFKMKRNYKYYKTENLTSVKYFFTRCNMICNYIHQQLIKSPVPYRRINPAGGKIIAFIGSDGAGKSTVINSVNKVLQKKVDIYYEYLGSGEGRSSFLRAPLQAVKKILETFKSGESRLAAADYRVKIEEKVSLVKAVWAIVLAFEKKKKINRIWKARARGMIVISDRYPQIEFPGINDGPLLYSWLNEKNRIKNNLAAWEYSIYKSATLLKPDLLIKMVVNLEIAKKRKPNDPIGMIERKVEIIEKINIPAREVTIINANNQLGKVLHDVYSAVSKTL